MQLKTLLPAALAWSATATLVVPNTLSSDPLSIDIDVPCFGCPVAKDKVDGVREWDESGNEDTQIALKFEVADHRVLLNGQTIYPVDPSSPFTVSAKQMQIPGSSSELKITDDELVLSTRVEFSRPETMKGNLVYEMEILGMEDKVVHVPTVMLAVNEDAEYPVLSKLMLVPTYTTEADAMCTTIICRIRAQIAAKTAALKQTMSKIKAGCLRLMGMNGHDAQSMGAPSEGKPSPLDRIKGGPNKFSGKHGKHGKHGNGKKPCPGRHGIMSKLAHGLVIFIRHILLPVLIGIAAGMAVSAIGMVIGQLVFMIWTRLRGGERGDGYIAVYQVVDEEGLEAATHEEEPLPLYEAGEHVLPPAYSDEKEESK